MRKITIREKQRKSTKIDNNSELPISSNFTKTSSKKTTTKRHLVTTSNQMIISLKKQSPKRTMDLTDKKTSNIIKSTKIKGVKGDPEVILEINLTIIGPIIVMQGESLLKRVLIRNLLNSDINGQQIRIKDIVLYLFYIKILLEQRKILWLNNDRIDHNLNSNWKVARIK